VSILRSSASALCLILLVSAARGDAVSEPARTDLGSAIAELLAERIPAQTGERVARIDLPPLDALSREAVLAGVRAELTLAASGARAGSNPVSVSLWRGDALVRRAVITARVTVIRRTLLASRALRSGAVLTAADLELADREATSAHPEALGDAADAIGRTLTRHLAEGEPLRANALASAPLVRRGARVALRLQRGRLAIEAVGRAEQDGQRGEWIRVQNVASKLVVLAQVVAEGEVHVEL
jgi:flagella basal body P-ring formation protein FlgA